MKLSDRDIKSMYGEIKEIHTDVAVIKTKCTAMEKHLSVQNGRLNEHATAIQEMSVNQEGMKTGQKYMMVIIGGVGGLAGSILTLLLQQAVSFVANGGIVI